MRSPWVRGAFLLLALAAAVWAMAATWDEVVRSVHSLPPWALGVGLAASFGYVALTMLSWRAIISDAAPLDPRLARRIFYSSQMAKYLPGGVWNYVAAAEAGRDHSISRRRSVASLLVSAAISVLTGLLLAVFAILFGPADLWRDYWWAAAAIPVGAVALMPPVLNRIVSAAFSLVRREGLGKPIGWGAALRASGWALAAWIVAGAQVWLFLVVLGASANATTLLLAVGGYALGWTAGFLAVVVPAGVGVREAALAAALAGTVEPGAVVVVVLLARLLTTTADVALGLAAALAMSRDRRRDPSGGQAGRDRG